MHINRVCLPLTAYRKKQHKMLPVIKKTPEARQVEDTIGKGDQDDRLREGLEILYNKSINLEHIDRLNVKIYFNLNIIINNNDNTQ